MAAAALEEELNCSICLSTYQDPVLLSCGHNFCQGCIEKAWDNQNSKTYTCPECRMKFNKRPRLKKNRKLCNIVSRYLSTQVKKTDSAVLCSYCLDSHSMATKTCVQCETSFCENHLQKHNEAVDHDLTEPTASLESRKCLAHQEILKYYCAKDDCCICVSCYVAGNHKNHQVDLLPAACEKKKTNLQDALRKLNFQTKENEQQLRNVEKDKEAVTMRAAEIIANIKGLFLDIKKQLETKENQILDKIGEERAHVIDNLLEESKELDVEKATVAEKLLKIKELCALTDPLTFLKTWERSEVKDYKDFEESHFSEESDMDDLEYDESDEGSEEGSEDFEEAVSEDVITTLDEELIADIIQTGLDEFVDMLPVLREQRGI
uniref:E3 ubiquitin/ISG15 ligase TRIM25-like n=1 Tax=Geotrypetes seraphini TaxID=260995 RepID=A0A6P8SJI3_GEOSA|nr:E3 ubiquitin/ISG15 ligase TRIM25-like [Geotrypetes seraphini]XP_033818673.1 E3 ubiquitin/ISG15 ligase TRIM25-like [Geotrypetes seraphini]